MLVRITGKVLVVDRREGSKLNENTGEFKPWVSHTVRVLVANRDLVEFGAFGADFVPPAEGANIDVAAECSIRRYNGNATLNASFVGLWADIAGESRSVKAA